MILKTSDQNKLFKKGECHEKEKHKADLTNGNITKENNLDMTGKVKQKPNERSCRTGLEALKNTNTSHKWCEM